MSIKRRPSGLKVALQFVLSLLVLLAVRFYFFEIFVIPSGSMYPKLHVNDYVLVSKFDFGFRFPFTQNWLKGPNSFTRNSIVVFKAPDDSKFFIKRLVGLSGDQIYMYKDFVVSINDMKVTHTKLEASAKMKLAQKMGFSVEDFEAYKESWVTGQRTILAAPHIKPPYELSPEELNYNLDKFEIPQGELFFLGDHRHRSYDGRFFGYLSANKVVGRARWLALSCNTKNGPQNGGCGLTDMRLSRMGQSLAF